MLYENGHKNCVITCTATWGTVPARGYSHSCNAPCTNMNRFYNNWLEIPCPCNNVKKIERIQNYYNN